MCVSKFFLSLELGFPGTRSGEGREGKKRANKKIRRHQSFMHFATFLKTRVEVVAQGKGINNVERSHFPKTSVLSLEPNPLLHHHLLQSLLQYLALEGGVDAWSRDTPKWKRPLLVLPPAKGRIRPPTRPLLATPLTTRGEGGVDSPEGVLLLLPGR